MLMRKKSLQRTHMKYAGRTCDFFRIPVEVVVHMYYNVIHMYYDYNTLGIIINAYALHFTGNRFKGV